MQLLAIEDSPLDYEMLVATLRLQDLQVQPHRVESAQGLRDALTRQGWDIVISDHELPGFSSAEAFDIVSGLDSPPPFIIVSGMIGEDVAVAAMRRGVDDYLIKGRLARLGMAIRNAVDASSVRRGKAAAEARLRESQQQLQHLSAHLQTLIDDERAAISREIHDEIGGTLTAVRYDLEMVERHAADSQRERLLRALSALAQAGESTQRIMRNLHPPILNAGLVAALEWQADQFRERSGMEVQFRCNVARLDAGKQPAMAVYRTCQEALTNIGKHARATQVVIDVHYAHDLISMEISDNGGGFAPADLRKPGSLGLRGLSERARAVDGHVDISCEGGSTTLMLWVPLTAGAGPQGLEAIA